ncbi:MAG: glycosyltransferase family 2 protein [Kiritimatiellae bacterium]|nr:glycosyltransferase family 2 protein [Kiritimatiellia bacterium]
MTEEPREHATRGRGEVLVSVVTPAYNEEGSLQELYERLKAVLDDVTSAWEWIVVDDHSADGTFRMLRDISAKDARVRGFRLARNCGAHAAVTCGLHRARGGCAIVMASDLQDPPEKVADMLTEWREGAQVVWAVRSSRGGEPASKVSLARLYYAMMRRLVGLPEMSATGADFFLVDRCVLDAFRRFPERNVDVVVLITWMGFRSSFIEYDKKAREHGRSGWTLAKKVKVWIDSVASFSYFPIRLMSAVGVLTAVLGLLYALVVMANAIGGSPPQGWSSLMVVVLILGGMQMLTMGVLGEYVWRTLDESRRRPRYLLEESTETAGPLEGMPVDRTEG